MNCIGILQCALCPCSVLPSTDRSLCSSPFAASSRFDRHRFLLHVTRYGLSAPQSEGVCTDCDVIPHGRTSAGQYAIGTEHLRMGRIGIRRRRRAIDADQISGSQRGCRSTGICGSGRGCRTTGICRHGGRVPRGHRTGDGGPAWRKNPHCETFTSRMRIRSRPKLFLDE
jgi:hypothetical protein